MGSNRLPKKALLDLGGCSILERVVINLRASKFIDEVIITTTTNIDDDPIEEFSRQKKIALFRGSENNVLNRYLDAAKLFGADIIVRATGDNPFVSYEIADLLINHHISNNSDFTGIEKDNIPMGVATEIISCKAIEFLLNQDMNFNYSEYMTFYFTNNPSYFSIKILPAPTKYFSENPKARLTIDYPEDLNLSRKIVKIINPIRGPISLDSILKLLKEDPELIHINQNMKIIWKDQKKMVNEIKQNTRIV